MPSNLFARSSLHELFADESWLYPEFLPERLPHRDAQIASLVSALQPAARNQKADNVFCFGRTGTGKTSTVKFVVRELTAFAKSVKSLYVNGFEYGTRHAALAAIASFFSVPVPRRGIGTDEILHSLKTRVSKLAWNAVIVLDEADQWANDSENQRLFYDLARHQELSGMKIALVMLSNDADLLVRLEDRVRSSLGQSRLEFPSYLPVELKDILRERALHAFRPNAFEADAINVAAAVGAKNGGDCRLAIQSLLAAGRLAEKENAPVVSGEHVSRISGSVTPRPIEKAAAFLSEHEKLVLSFLLDEEMSAGELHRLFCAKSSSPLSDRAFRDVLSGLVKKKVVLVRLVAKGRRGRSRLVRRISPSNA